MAVGGKANRYNFLIAFFVTLGSFTYGYNSSVTAGVIGLPSFFAYLDITSSTTQGDSIIGAINGVYLAGGAIGCWTLAWLADTIGRQRTIQVVCVICVISAAIQAGSVHVAMFLVGRLINGFGVGLMNSVIPLFQSEISPAAQRGRLVGFHGFILVAGYSCGGWTTFGTYHTSNTALQWRLPLALQILAPLLLLCGSPWIPESPRWLVRRGHGEKGLKILEDLHRTPDDPNARGAKMEYEQIKAQVALEAEENVDTLFKCLAKPHIRKRMILGFLVQWYLQSTGVLVVFNYQTLLYANLGVTGSIPLLLLALYNLIAAFFNLCNALALDRFGRIRIIATGMVGCAVVLSIYTALVAEYADTDNRVGNAFAILCLFLFAVFYGGCLDASSYVYVSEIFPNSVRARGVGFSISGLFLSNILYTQVAPTALSHVGWRFFLLFILLPAAGLYPFLKYCPETKLLSLEELAGAFGDPVAADMDTESEKRETSIQHREGDVIA
ncbi:general substrate transporter [Aspergillus pseudoustus]|uniref:General substrate transporter n=1 Tax=Aspergillus pseudoustus TaxID=1810923 RepID=A0ABR4IAG5_9EURO